MHMYAHARAHAHLCALAGRVPDWVELHPDDGIEGLEERVLDLWHIYIYAYMHICIHGRGHVHRGIYAYMDTWEGACAL